MKRTAAAILILALAISFLVGAYGCSSLLPEPDLVVGIEAPDKQLTASPRLPLNTAETIAPVETPLPTSTPEPTAEPTEVPIVPTEEPTVEPEAPTTEPALEVTETETPAPTPDAINDVEEQSGYTIHNGVNFRHDPNKSSLIIRVLRVNTPVIITGEGGDWYRVKIGEYKGYVAKEFIELGDAPTPEPTATPKPTPAPTATPKPTPEPTATPKPTAKPTATPKPTPKPTSTPKPTAKPTATPKPTPTPAPTPAPTPTPKPTATPTPSPTPKPTATPIPTDLPMYSADPDLVTEEDVELLAKFITYEARYASNEGQYAVASVVYNRFRSGNRNFPDPFSETAAYYGIAAILFQHNQFVKESDIADLEPTPKSLNSARYVLIEHGSTLPTRVFFYRAKSLGKYWAAYASFLTYYTTVDANNFYIAKDNF